MGLTVPWVTAPQPCALPSELSLSTKAMLSREKKARLIPEPEERILLIASARAIVETLDPLAGGIQALGGRWGEKNDMKLTTNVVRLSRIGEGVGEDSYS